MWLLVVFSVLASDINKVVVVGRLTRDSELRYTKSGTALCKFAVAVNRSRKVGERWEDEASFFDVALWGRQGEAINQYLVKGKQVGIDGELRQDRWDQDGQSRSRVEIVAFNVMLLGGGRGGPGSDGGGSRQESGIGGDPSGDRGDPSGDRGDPGAGSAGQPNDDFDDDIPF